MGYTGGMPIPDPIQPDADGLLWGYRGAFRAAVVEAARGETTPAPKGKWIAFLPASLPLAQRTALFDDLARRMLLDPDARACGCASGKMALHPIHLHPDRTALMFYGAVGQEQALLVPLRRHARAVRKTAMAQGRLAVGDGFLGGWFFKTDAETQAELDAGRHPAQQGALLALLEYEAGLHRQSRRRRPG